MNVNVNVSENVRLLGAMVRTRSESARLAPTAPHAMAAPPAPDRLTSLPSELLARAVSLLPSAADIARADRVCRLFHESPPHPAPEAVCLQALRPRCLAPQWLPSL